MPSNEKAYIFSRVLHCDGEDCSIGIAIPQLSANDHYVCCYEIITPERTINREASGVDAIQAFMMALMQAGSFLYSGQLIDPAKAFWLCPEDMGYLGLPIPIEDRAKIPNGLKLILAV